MTRKGIDNCILALNIKKIEESEIFASELSLQKYMKKFGLVYKKAEVDEIGTVEIRERLVQKDETATEEFQEDWIVHYSQKVIKKTDFE